MNNASKNLQCYDCEIGKDFIENECVNFGKVFTSKNLGEHLSITCSYTPLQSKGTFVGLDENLHSCKRTDVENYYYGMSPVISADKIINAISRLQFSNFDKLNEFVKTHNKAFMLNEGQEKYLPSMARYFALSLANNYCLSFEIARCIDVAVKIEQNTNVFKKSINYKINGTMIDIIGCPTDEVIKAFDEFNFNIEEDKIYAIKSKDKSANSKTLTEIYFDKGFIKLYNSNIFYSGVLFRPLKFKEQDTSFSNSLTYALEIEFERSTYGTVFALDCDSALQNPIIINDVSTVNEFFIKDEEVQDEYLFNKESISLSDINLYLQKSYNVHQMGVSANIITKDNVLILCKRGDKTIDKDKIYPSANGNAELIDKDVEFYKYSVNEDLPTTSIDEFRIDFNAELSREVYAELKLILLPQEWDYLGFSVSGINKNLSTETKQQKSNESGQITKRRLHFNILAKQNSNETFDSIYSKQKLATESYEAKEIVGIRLNVYKNIGDLIKKGSLKIFKEILRNQGLVTSILALLLFFSTLSEGILFSLNGVNKVVTAIFAFFVALSAIGMIYNRCKNFSKEKKHIKDYYIIKSKNVGNKTNKIKHKIKNRYHFVPVTLIMLNLFFEGQIGEDY